MKCQYCGKECKDQGIAAHERACKENPANKKEEQTLENTENVKAEQAAAQEGTVMEAADVSVPTEGQLNRAYNSFREQLAAEEHVDIMIPPTQLYPEGSNLPICLNGVVYTIPVGIMFEKGVPRSIYNVWKDSYDADREARQKMKKVLTGVISVG